MEEAQRFLRYVFPGLAFLTELLFYLFLFSYPNFIRLMKTSSSGLSVPVSGIIIAGGIGFLLGIFYYSLIWTKWAKSKELGVDHTPLIKELIDRQLIELIDRATEKPVSSDKISNRGAWRIITAYWHTKTETSKRIKAANTRLNRLADITHGLGAACLGSLAAFLISSLLFLHFGFHLFWGFEPNWLSEVPILSRLPTFSTTVGNIFNAVLFILLSLSIFTFHCWNYRDTSKDLQSVIELIVMDEMRIDHEKESKPRVFFISKVDQISQKAGILHEIKEDTGQLHHKEKAEET